MQVLNARRLYYTSPCGRWRERSSVSSEFTFQCCWLMFIYCSPLFFPLNQPFVEAWTQLDSKVCSVGESHSKMWAADPLSPGSCERGIGDVSLHHIPQIPGADTQLFVLPCPLQTSNSQLFCIVLNIQPIIGNLVNIKLVQKTVQSLYLEHTAIAVIIMPTVICPVFMAVIFQFPEVVTIDTDMA